MGRCIVAAVLAVAAVIAAVCCSPCSADKGKTMHIYDEIKELKAKIEKLENCVSPNVGFMAAIKTWKTLVRTYEHQSKFEKDAKIIFDKEILDTSASYDSSTGAFTCPVAGLYQISVNLGVFDNVALFTLQINNEKISTALADDRGAISGFRGSGEEKDWATGASSMTVMLREGDEVTVVSSYSHPSHPSYLNENDDMPNLNTFEGYLIRSTKCDF